ncbi:hypothetical protein [Sorangium sp. So ce1151]|uniref:hypothetical protein n=1 Tax=Sorangium sp. So ce1151 TaxID=3133332 RepID=UPI003F60EB41
MISRRTALLSLVAVASCSDDEPGDTNTGYGDGPLYLIATEVNAGDHFQVYLVLSPSFDASTSIDPTRGVELQGRPIPVVHNGAVYVSDPTAPTITRYVVTDGGQLAPDRTVSFASVGVQGVDGALVHVLSDEKAYLFDPASLRIIVWNPGEMKLTGAEIDLTEISREGYVPYAWLEAFNAKSRGDRLFIPVSWYDQDGNIAFGSALLTIDTSSDEVVAFSTDDRCGEAYMSIVAPSGDIYFFPSAEGSAQHYYGDGARRPSCVARVRAGADTFDPADDVLDLSALVSGRAAQGAVSDGATGFFFAAADDARWEDREKNGWSFWRIWHYDFETKEAREVTTLPWWAGSTYHYEIDGQRYLPFWEVTPNDGSKTVVFPMGGAADPAPLFSFDASFRAIARLR